MEAIKGVEFYSEPRAVQAIEECWCLALPMKHYRPLLLNDTLFLRKLCVTLSHKNYRNIVSLTQNQSFPLVNRLAAFILLSQEGDLYHEKHTQAAEYLGVSYRHLLYVLAQFINDGLLIKSKKGYLIKNRKQLSGLALEMGVEFYSKYRSPAWKKKISPSIRVLHLLHLRRQIFPCHQMD